MMQVCDHIELAQRAQVEDIRRRAGHELSAHAFASLYMWQEQLGLSLRMLSGAYTVHCRRMGAWFFPCGAPEAALKFAAGLRPGERLCYLRAQDAQLIQVELPGRFRLYRRPEADEYLYDIDAHVALAGGEYANLRTQVHKVEREYAVRTEPLCPANACDALSVIRAWNQRERRFEGSGLSDDEADMRAMEHLTELGIEGVVVYLDGRPGAVVAGFALTGDVFDMAVAKCGENLQGLSYYSKRELMKQVSARCAQINLEEDLGLSGLRRMKRGMRPMGFNLIWEAVRI